MTSTSPSYGEVLESNNFFQPLTCLATPIFSHSNETFIAFTGIGASIDLDNQYVFPILKANVNTYSATHLDSSDEPQKVSDI